MGGELFDIVIKRCEQKEEETNGEDRRPYTEQEVSLIIRQLVDAVGYCHSKGVGHPCAATDTVAPLHPLVDWPVFQWGRAEVDKRQ